MNLYDAQGHRKYLTAAERDAFLQVAEEAEDRAVRTFCGTLAYTGCRISEALALTVDRVDLKDGTLIFESLKKRRHGVYRAIPAPPALLRTLDWTWCTTCGARRGGGTAAKAYFSGPGPATPPGGMSVR